MRVQREKPDYLVDITGYTCPIPMIMARKAIKDAKQGQIIKFIGTSKEEVSRKEILISISNLKQQIIKNIENGENDNWYILLKKS